MTVEFLLKEGYAMRELEAGVRHVVKSSGVTFKQICLMAALVKHCYGCESAVFYRVAGNHCARAYIDFFSKKVKILTRGINSHRNEKEFPCKLILVCVERNSLAAQTGFTDKDSLACLCSLARCLLSELRFWVLEERKSFNEFLKYTLKTSVSDILLNATFSLFQKEKKFKLFFMTKVKTLYVIIVIFFSF